MHGTRMLSVSEIREQYGRSLVDLKNEGRWTFLNTFFSVSEACLYAQMVDRLDLGMLSLDASNQSYHGLFRVVNKALFRAHVGEWRRASFPVALHCTTALHCTAHCNCNTAHTLHCTAHCTEGDPSSASMPLSP